MNSLINLDMRTLSDLNKKNKNFFYFRKLNRIYKSKTINNIRNKFNCLDCIHELFFYIREEITSMGISPILDINGFVDDYSFYNIMENLIEIYEDPNEDYVSYSDALYTTLNKYSELLQREGFYYELNHDYSTDEVLKLIDDIYSSDFELNTGIDISSEFYEDLREITHLRIRDSKILYFSSPSLDSKLELLYNKDFSTLGIDYISDILCLIKMSLINERFMWGDFYYASGFKIAYSGIVYDSDSKYEKFGAGKYVLVVNIYPDSKFKYYDAFENINCELIENTAALLSILEQSIVNN